MCVTNRMIVMTVVSFLLSLGESHGANIVKVTDNILVKDTERLGVHFSGDNYYDSVLLKKRISDNFEGSIRRLHAVSWLKGQPEPGKFMEKGSTFDPFWADATYHVLSGPDIWKSGKVKGIETSSLTIGKQDQKVVVYDLDREIRWHEGLNGILLEKTDLTAGQHPWFRKVKKRVNGETIRTIGMDSQYCTPETTKVIVGDVPPGAFGVAALEMDGTESAAWIKYRAQFYDAAAFDGEWKVRLWARAKSGRPQLTIKPSVPGTTVEVPLTDQWRKMTFDLQVGKGSLLMFVFTATGGKVVVDDIEVWQDDEGTNPTAFRDEIVDTFRKLNPGTVRYLRNGINTFRNDIMPGIRTYSTRGRGRYRFGRQEFYLFCEHLGVNPWATLPGTLLLEEMDEVMEYHAAPADVGLGKLRAELGHPEPWTESFDKIYLQFGNEVATFSGSGYPGPDYWHQMIARAKKSPYYDPDKFVFILNEQGGGLERLYKWHPNFDRGCINGYHIFGLYSDQIEAAKDREGFYDWVFASAWHTWMDERNNKNWKNLQTGLKLNKEMTIYEGGNYHTTFSSEENQPIEQINKMMAGLSGGMSSLHTMLILLKHHGARVQQNFCLSQHSFSPGGGFGNLKGNIRGWGGVLNIGNDQTRRFRPRFLALQLANEVIGGDLVETIHSGDDLTFSVTNRFGGGYGPSKNPQAMTVSNIPRIHSYAFKEGKRRGLILVSNDPRKDRTVKLEFPGGVDKGAADYWLLDGEDLESSNELDWAEDRPQVTLKKRTIDAFKSGSEVLLPKGTMVALEWHEE